MIAFSLVDASREMIHQIAITTGYLFLGVAFLGSTLVVFVTVVDVVFGDLDRRELDPDPSALLKSSDHLFADDPHLRFEPEPEMRLDWSTGPDPTESDVRDAMAALDLVELYAHPLPRSPRQPFRDSWKWNTKMVGVWTEEPTLLVDSEFGREEVEADLSSWEIEAVEEPVGTIEWEGDSR